MNTLFLDFAETLGYRNISEFESDLKIISKYAELDPGLISKKYKGYLRISQFYDRSLSFKDFKAELEFTTKHFSRFLTKELDIPNGEFIGEKIATDKYQTLTHSFFPEVGDALTHYAKDSQIYILSDGRPSRRNTLDLLGLNQFCKGYFISDEVGFVKSDTGFYNKVLQKIGIKGKVYFIDDAIDNLNAFCKVLRVECILMDRKHLLDKKGLKYLVLDSLPSLLYLNERN
ncbi:MAG: HAD family hydrolase [Candidatus Shapirobacteria bacterium]|jgi:FMN phosphatase YigB (HAD superfamily)